MILLGTALKETGTVSLFRSDSVYGLKFQPSQRTHFQDLNIIHSPISQEKEFIHHPKNRGIH